MEKDVKLREFCLQLALTIEPDHATVDKVIKVARDLEKYILDG